MKDHITDNGYRYTVGPYSVSPWPQWGYYITQIPVVFKADVSRTRLENELRNLKDPNLTGSFDVDHFEKTGEARIAMTWAEFGKGQIKSEEDCRQEAHILAQYLSEVLPYLEEASGPPDEDIDRPSLAKAYATHIFNGARKKALSACRYRQRLAALEAELQAEIEEQVSLYREAHDLEDLMGEFPSLDREALDMAFADLTTK